MKRAIVWLYHLVWIVGAALVGLIVGFLLKPPPASVSSVLIAIGVVLLGLGTLWGKRLWKRAC